MGWWWKWLSHGGCYPRKPGVCYQYTPIILGTKHNQSTPLDHLSSKFSYYSIHHLYKSLSQIAPSTATISLSTHFTLSSTLLLCTSCSSHVLLKASNIHGLSPSFNFSPFA